MRVIVIRRTDGGVSVMWPGPAFTTPEREVREWEKGSPYKAVSWRWEEETNLPRYDSATRNDWQDDGARVRIRAVQPTRQ